MRYLGRSTQGRRYREDFDGELTFLHGAVALGSHRDVHLTESEQLHVLRDASISDPIEFESHLETLCHFYGYLRFRPLSTSHDVIPNSEWMTRTELMEANAVFELMEASVSFGVHIHENDNVYSFDGAATLLTQALKLALRPSSRGTGKFVLGQYRA